MHSAGLQTPRRPDNRRDNARKPVARRRPLSRPDYTQLAFIRNSRMDVALNGSSASPAAAPGGFDYHDLAVLEREGRLAGIGLLGAIATDDEIAAGLAIGAAVQAVGAELAAVRLQRNAGVVIEHAQSADDAVAAAVPAGAARA